MKLVFWLSLALVVYVYVGYPLLLWTWARLRPQPVRKAPRTPTVSVVVAAYDEEVFIGRRVANLLTLDYPTDRLQIIVVSDGSTDRTEDIVKGFADERVRLVALGEHRGKADALNAGVAAAAGEIVVFTDARQHFAPDAVRELVANFADPAVGAVSGELHLAADGDGDIGRTVGLYWSYEKWLRRLESAIDSCVGATGAIYAIRRRLFQPLPAGTVLDDLVTPMLVVLGGHRTVFEPAARAYDRAASRVQAEFARKVRTLAGNYQAFVQISGLFNPVRNRLVVQVVSHKVGRLAVPFALAGMFVSNLSLEGAFYRSVLWGQLAFYGAGLVAPALQSLLSVVRVFLVLNTAAVVGLVRFATSRQIAWTKAGPPAAHVDGRRQWDP